MVIKRPNFNQPAITFNQWLQQNIAPKQVPDPLFHRESIRRKLPTGKFKDLLMKTMIPLEEHNRREQNMTPSQRKKKWDEIREEAHAVDDEPQSSGFRVDREAYRQYKKAKRRGHFDER